MIVESNEVGYDVDGIVCDHYSLLIVPSKGRKYYDGSHSALSLDAAVALRVERLKTLQKYDKGLTIKLVHFQTNKVHSKEVIKNEFR